MELLIQLLLLVAGFVMLVKGADWFVDGSSSIARKFGIPQPFVDFRKSIICKNKTERVPSRFLFYSKS